MLFAAALTTVILLGYGGFTAWNALTGGDSDAPTEATATDFETSVTRAIYYGGIALGQGLDVNLVNDLGPFRDVADRGIYAIATERGAVEQAGRTATGARADVVASTLRSLDALQSAIVDWRDAVFNLRLGLVEDAHSAIDAAISQLQADLERWRSLDG